ncbi:MAG TPA: 3-hydroxylacyl-ACP dehydratase, partial [Permianibacter sp.]|nr:3-hydroxylacyl-ACP dehydratase [Permianibacter sp.]
MTLAFQQWSMAELLPHAGDMILLDAVLSCDDEQIVVTATPHADTILVDDKGVLPAWTGIEYMAQAIACFAGVHERVHGRPPKVGFLLGTRSYDSKVAAFA